MGHYELDPVELKKIANCHYLKRNKNGEVDKTASPTLYTKVKRNSKMGTVYTNFHRAIIKKGGNPSLRPRGKKV